ncbi:hypothetical protein [Methylomonas koyamae]|uniref:hypothetical protein n=1 Tax=Methylomonas koyamae TaxID=702114 RepID=UPI00155DAA35|nr:hypothetical protein [Methylomonas koyamae]
MKLSATLTAFALAGLIAANAEAASTAIDREAYSHDADSGAHNPDWLTDLPDTLKLSNYRYPALTTRCLCTAAIFRKPSPWTCASSSKQVSGCWTSVAATSTIIS